MPDERLIWATRFYDFYLPSSLSLTGGGTLKKAYIMWLEARAEAGDGEALEKLKNPQIIKPDTQWKVACSEGEWETRAKAYHENLASKALEGKTQALEEALEAQVRASTLTIQVINSLLVKIETTFCSPTRAVNAETAKHLASSLSLLAQAQKTNLENFLASSGGLKEA
jgi:hypothetical protein